MKDFKLNDRVEVTLYAPYAGMENEDKFPVVEGVITGNEMMVVTAVVENSHPEFQVGMDVRLHHKDKVSTVRGLENE